MGNIQRIAIGIRLRVREASKRCNANKQPVTDKKVATIDKDNRIQQLL